MKGKEIKKPYQRPEVKSEKGTSMANNGYIYAPGSECGPAPGP